jgi:RimJ/RimL family protein N-acetyltransferase
MVAKMTLRPAAAADLAAVMAIERTPGFERFVGRSTLDEHRALMASANHVYLVGEEGDGPIVAFAILRDLEDAHGNVYLKRIAVSRPGEGLGGAYLRLVGAWVFARPAPHRFSLDCFAHNLRAQRAYEKLGFSRDGVLRQAYRAPDGVRYDLIMMALIRAEWTDVVTGG